MVGAAAGYVLFTPRGRELRRRLEPALEEVAHELVQLRGTLNRALGVASEGWSVLNEAMGDRAQAGTFANHRQTSPF
jgi:hypothetical protein